MKATALLLLVLAGCSSRSDTIDASFDMDTGPDSGPRPECDPGRDRVCVGDVVHACDQGRIGAAVETCGFEACTGGACIDPCAAAVGRGDSIGCDYVAVDLDNAVEILGLASRTDCARFGAGAVATERNVCLNDDPFSSRDEWFVDCPPQGDCPSFESWESTRKPCEQRNVCVLDAQGAAFGLALSNPDPGSAAEVTIRDAEGNSHTLTIEAGGAATVVPSQVGLRDQSLDGSGVAPGGYSIHSNRPVAAYQLNPLHDASVASNDGSLLLATHALGTKYVVATTPSFDIYPFDPNMAMYEEPGAQHFSSLYAGYTTIVATGEGTTSVTVEVTATVEAGRGFDRIPKGETRTFELDQYEALTLEAAAFVNPLHPVPVDDGDLTGTWIDSTQPIAVFVGHEASLLSADLRSPTCCADHLEEQLMPTSTWGTAFAVARSAPRGTGDRLRIVAAADGTRVRFFPEPLEGCPTLDAGEHCDVDIDRDTDVETTKPVIVMHFLLSAGPRLLSTSDPLLRAGSIPDSGDPSMSFVVPTEQYRAAYGFVVPDRFGASWLFVSALEGDVMLDGMPIGDQLVQRDDRSTRTGRVPITSGPHRLTCPGTCSAQVAGWSTGVSFMFPAGLRLQQIAVY